MWREEGHSPEGLWSALHREEAGGEGTGPGGGGVGRILELSGSRVPFAGCSALRSLGIRCQHPQAGAGHPLGTASPAVVLSG